MAKQQPSEQNGVRQADGLVVKLDRGFPLVRLEDGSTVRCEHAADLVKGSDARAVIGDKVCVVWPQTHDKAFIARIYERRNAFIRKDPAQRSVSQTLAANFDIIIIAQPLPELNTRRLERELVLAHETGAHVVVVLTKADLAQSSDELRERYEEALALAGKDVSVMVVSRDDEAGISAVRDLIAPGKTAVLIGKSGAGKSSLINVLVGASVQETGEVRQSDRRGRHTTVSREIVALPNGGFVVDMPGVRGLGMWESEDGIGTAFSDIEQLAAACKFADCSHVSEPGCAVLAALERGEISAKRLASYRSLSDENKQVKERKERARWQKQTHARRKSR